MIGRGKREKSEGGEGDRKIKENDAKFVMKRRLKRECVCRKDEEKKKTKMVGGCERIVRKERKRRK